MVEKEDIVEYRREPSEIIKTINVIKKIIFLFLSYFTWFLGRIIRKQHKRAIIGI